jgi:ankyrin repeat protein
MNVRVSSALLSLLLLVEPPLVNAKQELAEAARIGDMDTVEQLLAGGGDPNDTGTFATPVLHWVVHYGELATAIRLLEAGADPNLRNADTLLTPLSLALDGTYPAMVKVLLEHGANPNDKLADGDTPLMLTARTGITEFTQLLLEHGAEPDARHEEFGYSALMLAANAGDLAAVKLLLASGADPAAATTRIGTENWIKPNGQPGFGNGVGIIRGGTPADRGRRDPLQGGMTALLYAARHDHVDVAAALLDAGADWYGRTPLWEAVNVRNLYVDDSTLENGVDRAAMLEVIRALLDKGAEVNARTKETPPFRNFMLGVGSLEWVDFTGQTPFLTAALAGDMTVMKLLLEHGADPFITTYQGTSALMAAAGVNWVIYQTYTEGPQQLLDAVKFCHELGMDVNQANSMGLTALHGAANRGSLDIIGFLTEKGAKLDALDKENRSPLDWAKGVFLATHPAEEKPEAMAMITDLLQAGGLPPR